MKELDKKYIEPKVTHRKIQI